MNDGRSSVPKAFLSCLLYLVAGPVLILVNKSLLQSGFAYPIALSSIGQLSSAVISNLMIHTLDAFRVERKMSWGFYLGRVLPIGLCQAATLKFGMQAYLYLPVSFIQIMKAFSPATTMFAAALMGKTVSTRQAMAVSVICLATVMSATGEVRLDSTGVFCLAAAELAECSRLLMSQMLLQDLKFGVVESLATVAPATFGWLAVFSIMYETSEMRENGAGSVVEANAFKFFAAACAGFMVNIAGFLVIKSTNAVTLKVLGTARNAGLVAFCGLVLGEIISDREVAGYSTAIMAFIAYSYFQLVDLRDEAEAGSASAINVPREKIQT